MKSCLLRSIKYSCIVGIINEKQKSVLKQSFANETYPRKDTIQKLSEQLGLKETTVYNWFKCERIRTKKKKRQKISKGKLICVCVILLIWGYIHRV